MTVYFAVMAIFGQLLVAYLLGYPIGSIIDKIAAPLGRLSAKRWEWDSAHRD